MKKLFFRFNCGNMWGLGHLYRNLTLIEEMKARGYECVVITNNNGVCFDVLQENDIRYIVIQEYESSDELASIIYRESTCEHKVLFWDRLNSEVSYIDGLLRAGIRVIVYDNYDKSAMHASMCINTRVVEMDGKLPHYCGPEYQLLRKEIQYYASKEKRIEKKVNKIVLQFGGTDPLNILSRCFETLDGLTEFSFEYIAGKDTDRNLSSRAETLTNVSFEQGVTDFGRRLFNADLCVVAGGVSMYEAAAIGTPMINLCHNEDQNFAASIFEEKVGSINLGIATECNMKALRRSVIDLAHDYEHRELMSRKMKSFVPANGIKQVCDLIETLFSYS